MRMSLLLNQVTRLQVQYKYFHCQDPPVYYEEEEEPCTGLCLVKKMEKLDAEMKKKKVKNLKKMKKVKKNKKDNVKVLKEKISKKEKAPCTGMCALMRQRTG